MPGWGESSQNSWAHPEEAGPWEYIWILRPLDCPSEKD